MFWRHKTAPKPEVTWEPIIRLAEDPNVPEGARRLAVAFLTHYDNPADAIRIARSLPATRNYIK